MSSHYQLQTFEARIERTNIKMKKQACLRIFYKIYLFKHIFKLFHYKKQADDLDDFQHIIYNMFSVDSTLSLSTEDVIVSPEAEHPRITRAPPRCHLWSDVG